MNSAIFNFSWLYLINDFWLGQVICTWENHTLWVLCKKPYNLGPFKKNRPWKRKSLMLERLEIALLRLPLKIPYIQTGYILSSPLLLTMSTHHDKSMRAAISTPWNMVLFCILMIFSKFGWIGYMKNFIQLDPGKRTFYHWGLQWPPVYL